MLVPTALLLLAALGPPAGDAASSPTETAPPEAAVPASAEQPRPLRPVLGDQRAPVAFEFSNGVILFKAKVGDREVDAMLDTGATGSLVDIEFARTASLSIMGKPGKVNTSRGDMPVWPVTGVTVLIPGQFEVDFPVLGGVDMAPARLATKRKVSFVLGADFARNFALIVDPSKNVFFFMPSGRFKSPESVKISLLSGKPHFEVHVGGEKAPVLIDTGFNGQLTLAPEAWTRMIPAGTPTGTAISADATGKPHATEAVVLRLVQLGTLHLDNVETARSSSATPGVGKIGMGILKRFRFALDIKAGSFWLAPLPAPRPNN
jgi:predicted aspartyl protease